MKKHSLYFIKPSFLRYTLFLGCFYERNRLAQLLYVCVHIMRCVLPHIARPWTPLTAEIFWCSQTGITLVSIDWDWWMDWCWFICCKLMCTKLFFWKKIQFRQSILHLGDILSLIEKIMSAYEPTLFTLETENHVLTWCSEVLTAYCLGCFDDGDQSHEHAKRMIHCRFKQFFTQACNASYENVISFCY